MPDPRPRSAAIECVLTAKALALHAKPPRALRRRATLEPFQIS